MTYEGRSLPPLRTHLHRCIGIIGNTWCVYRAIHLACSLPFFPSIMQLFNIWFLEFFNIPKDHILKFLRDFALVIYLRNVLRIYKIMFFKWELGFCCKLFYQIPIKIKIWTSSFRVIQLCVLRIKGPWRCV